MVDTELTCHQISAKTKYSDHGCRSVPRPLVREQRHPTSHPPSNHEVCQVSSDRRKEVFDEFLLVLFLFRNHLFGIHVSSPVVSAQLQVLVTAFSYRKVLVEKSNQ